MKSICTIDILLRYLLVRYIFSTFLLTWQLSPSIQQWFLSCFFLVQPPSSFTSLCQKSPYWPTSVFQPSGSNLIPYILSSYHLALYYQISFSVSFIYYLVNSHKILSYLAIIYYFPKFCKEQDYDGWVFHSVSCCLWSLSCLVTTVFFWEQKWWWNIWVAFNHISSTSPGLPECLVSDWASLHIFSYCPLIWSKLLCLTLGFQNK